MAVSCPFEYLPDHYVMNYVVFDRTSHLIFCTCLSTIGPIPSVKEREAGYTLDKSPAYRRAKTRTGPSRAGACTLNLPAVRRHCQPPHYHATLIELIVDNLSTLFIFYCVQGEFIVLQSLMLYFTIYFNVSDSISVR